MYHKTHIVFPDFWLDQSFLFVIKYSFCFKALLWFYWKTVCSVRFVWSTKTTFSNLHHGNYFCFHSVKVFITTTKNNLWNNTLQRVPSTLIWSKFSFSYTGTLWNKKHHTKLLGAKFTKRKKTLTLLLEVQHWMSLLWRFKIQRVWGYKREVIDEISIKGTQSFVLFSKINLVKIIKEFTKSKRKNFTMVLIRTRCLGYQKKRIGLIIFEYFQRMVLKRRQYMVTK